jgi:hypothetical protein
MVGITNLGAKCLSNRLHRSDTDVHEGRWVFGRAVQNRQETARQTGFF